MRLTDFTDYSLRTLIYLNRKKGLVTLNELSDSLNVSRNHLIKVTNKLVKHGLVDATRGRAGGLQIGTKARAMSIGQIIRLTEESIGLAGCHRDVENDCPLLPGCKLKKALNSALGSFFKTLDQTTLAEIS